MHQRPIRFRAIILISSAFVGLSACGSDEAKIPTLVFSPVGEPLTGGPLGRLSCEDALKRWFARASSNGTITQQSFLDDARRQFRLMDLDHDGFITPEELSRYRQPYAFGRRKGASRDDMDNPAMPRRPRKGSADEESRRGSQGETYEDHPDPVMSADRRNRNEITLDDFMSYQRQNFQSLNKARNGRLSEEELLQSCPN